jgi:hypothetical protein
VLVYFFLDGHSVILWKSPEGGRESDTTSGSSYQEREDGLLTSLDAGGLCALGITPVRSNHGEQL